MEVVKVVGKHNKTRLLVYEIIQKQSDQKLQNKRSNKRETINNKRKRKRKRRPER